MTKYLIGGVVIIVAVSLFLFRGSGSVSPSPTPSQTSIPGMTVTPTASPIPSPTLSSVFPSSVHVGDLVHLIGSNMTQVQSIQIGNNTWTVSQFTNVQDSQNITTKYWPNATGLFDVTIYGTDGSHSTLVQALRVN